MSTKFTDRFAGLAIWLDRRLHLVKLWETTAGHPIPKSSASWFYTFGSMTLVCFVIQIVTGIALALFYTPSAAEAYHTLEFLNFVQPLGWFLRGLHYWGSNCMVIIMALHMTQVFLWGAFKYPRELTWMSGVVLLFLTLGMSFSGQVLRFDADSYWGIGIGAAILGRIPFIGAQLVDLLLGAPFIGTDALSRFFALHVFVLPGAILALLAMHLRLVLGKGINEYPKPGVQVHPKTYDAAYQEIIRKEGIPFVPHGVNKDVVANGILLVLMVLLTVFRRCRGKELAAQALSCDRSGRDLSNHRHADLRWNHRAMVAAHGSLDERPFATRIYQGPTAVGIARRISSPKQAMPQLPFDWRRRRQTWA